MTVLSEANRLGDVLKYEAPSLYSREAVTVLAGSGADREMKVGEVIGKRTKSSVAVTPDAGNTGDGFATLATPALGADAEAGTYTLTCTATAVDAGTFEVLTPKGYKLPDLTVGQAYAGGHINLTVADGATDFVVGDKFTVDVSGDGKMVALDLTGTDGTQEAFGILEADVTAPDGVDTSAVAVARDAILAAAGIVWPAGISQAQKDQATAQLAARGILIRTSA